MKIYRFVGFQQDLNVSTLKPRMFAAHTATNGCESIYVYTTKTVMYQIACAVHVQLSSDVDMVGRTNTVDCYTNSL